MVSILFYSVFSVCLKEGGSGFCNPRNARDASGKITEAWVWLRGILVPLYLRERSSIGVTYWRGSCRWYLGVVGSNIYIYIYIYMWKASQKRQKSLIRGARVWCVGVLFYIEERSKRGEGWYERAMSNVTCNNEADCMVRDIPTNLWALLKTYHHGY